MSLKYIVCVCPFPGTLFSCCKNHSKSDDWHNRKCCLNIVKVFGIRQAVRWGHMNDFAQGVLQTWSTNLICKSCFLLLSLWLLSWDCWDCRELKITCVSCVGFIIHYMWLIANTFCVCLLQIWIRICVHLLLFITLGVHSSKFAVNPVTDDISRLSILVRTTLKSFKIKPPLSYGIIFMLDYYTNLLNLKPKFMSQLHWISNVFMWHCHYIHFSGVAQHQQ